MPPKSCERRPPSLRGRDQSSKPLTSSAKTRPASAPKAPNREAPAPTAPRTSARSEETRLEASSSSTGAPKSAASPPNSTNAVTSTEAPKDAAAPVVDPLQVAAQAYPWMYMTSTLEACFNSSEETALKFLEQKEQQVEQQEGEAKEQILRVETERTIEFLEELDSDDFAKTVPKIMQSFHSHGEACAAAENAALELALHNSPDPDDEEPLQPYYDILAKLELLHTEALELESSIIKLTSPLEGGATEDKDLPSARSRILGVISACLPVIRARLSNLSMAQELVDSAQENVSIGLRMESLGLE